MLYIWIFSNKFDLTQAIRVSHTIFERYVWLLKALWRMFHMSVLYFNAVLSFETL